MSETTSDGTPIIAGEDFDLSRATETIAGSEGVLTQPGADIGQPYPDPPTTDIRDPLNAAIAATAGDLEPADAMRVQPTPLDPLGTAGRIPPAPTPEQEATAIAAYISAGVEKALAPAGGSEIVTVAHLRAAIESLLRHLHLDHPENYLPKG